MAKLVHLVPYVTILKGNDETARRDRDISARSPRSPRSEQRAPPTRARNHCVVYPFVQNEGNEVNEWGATHRCLSKISFTSAAKGEVNEVNGRWAT